MDHTFPRLSVVDTIADLSPAKRKQGIEVVGPWGSSKAVVAAQLAQTLGVSLLYVTPGRIEAEGAFEDLSNLLPAEDLALLPAWEVLPSDVMEPTVDIIAERMSALKRISTAQKEGRPVYASVSARALMQRVVNPELLGRDSISLKVGEEHDLEDLVDRLVGMGYERELMVEQRGQVSVRGGIFDVFPISSELPFRLEFFGDEVESIRRFEPETQRSVDRLDEVDILPRSEKKLIAEQTHEAGSLDTLRKYFSKDCILAIDEPAAVVAEAHQLSEQFGESPFMTTWEEATPEKGFSTRLELAQVAYKSTEKRTRIEEKTHSLAGWAGRLDGFWDQLKEWDLEGYSVQILCNNAGERRRLLKLLAEQGYDMANGTFDIRVDLGRLSVGFSSPSNLLTVLSENEIFGRKFVKRTRRRFAAGSAITTFSDLKAGDYVVHAHHGIGRYVGLSRFSGKTGDFLGIQYAGKDIMYVPVTHVDQVQRYTGGDGAVPKIDKLGGATWARKRGTVKKAVEEMTQELLKLYASRESQIGHAFSKDTHWQHEFEDSFEYDETPDQLRAIDEVKAGMESSKPMERLLCGDVGYGKTEVALRAAFKAVMDGFQVAVLVPTTVLADQHYNTFRGRFADYPVKVELLSRFRTPKQQRETVHRLRDGEVDVIVGTHRLTSGDIQFKKLGLVILDEEQRFGVKHKEKLKKMKTNVDVLTLSATPLPRTMYMSLMGARDMSVINTAPNDRLPIHTRIDVYNDKLVSEAIGRELARDGQVFYLHNRVQSIIKVANQIKKLVPHAKVAVGHGQMAEHELEKVMSGFITREFNVLVCTTIIGSGLDIPNANTIIVDRADTFGLAELYQLRGRVGRYKHRAFAYLLVPGDRAITEDAQRRLNALEQFSALGSGFRVAMRDLEIRGAGNLLGQRQSGHIASVGYDTYTEMIREAVSELKGGPKSHYAMPPFEIVTDGAIPNDYVPSESQKITLYKRIASLLSSDDIDDMYEELKDRFGEPPAPVLRLLEIMRVRALGSEVGATRIIATKNAVVLELAEVDFVQQEVQHELREVFPDRLQFALNQTPSVSCSLNGDEPVALVRKLLLAMAEVA